MLASDTFMKNHRQKKISFDFFLAEFIFPRCVGASHQTKQFTRAMTQK